MEPRGDAVRARLVARVWEGEALVAGPRGVAPGDARPSFVLKAIRLALAVVALLTVAASGSARADGSVILARPAVAGVVSGDLVVALGLDLRTVTAFDRQGARRWLVRVEGEGGGAGADLSLHKGGGRDLVAVHLGARLTLLDPRDGSVVAAREVGPVATPATPGCALERHGGACAVRCPCSLALVACDDLAPLGAPFTSPRLATVESVVGDAGVAIPGERDPARASRSGCGGREGALVGRAGDLIVATVPGATSRTAAIAAPPRVVGVHARSGEVRWSSEVLGRRWPAPGLVGVAADAGACWIGGLDGRLEVFDCQTGEARWSAKGLTHRGAAPQADLVRAAGEERAALLVRDGEHVRLRWLDTGHVRWSVHAPTERVVAAGFDGRIHLGAAVDVRVVAPADGATVAFLPAPAGPPPRHVEPLDGGTLVVAAGAVSRAGSDGGERARRALAPLQALHVGDSALAAVGRGRVTVVDRDSLLPVHELTDGTYRVLGLDGGLGRGVIAVLRQDAASDAGGASEVRLIRYRGAGGP